MVLYHVKLTLIEFFRFLERGFCTPHRMDDEFLMKFLRARFWKVENAYKLVRIYFSYPVLMFNISLTLPYHSQYFYTFVADVPLL